MHDRDQAAPTDESVSRALEWLEARGAEIEALTRDLVEIPSHTPDVAGCSAVARRYRDALVALAGGSLEVALVDGEGHGDHLVARTPAASAGRVLLVGHHDTVFPESVFRGFREDGALLRGPGVLDMKGGLAVIAYAVGALEHAGLLARVPVEVISVSDEEIGSPCGKRIVAESAKHASAALVFESGRASDVIITRRKGTGAFVATAHGKAAHAGNAHQEGRNAIRVLARFIERIESRTDYASGITVNVGRVEGGIGKNTVPDRAAAHVDFRFARPEDAAPLLEGFAADAKAAAESMPGTSIVIEGGVGRPPLSPDERALALLREYGACARAFGLGDGEAPLLGGGSDANTTSAVGCPSIDGLGPRGKGFHTVDEFIERATLVPKAQALARFLAGRAGR